eukprot:1159211-Pelagomonas_calceolata.AAC.12
MAETSGNIRSRVREPVCACMQHLPSLVVPSLSSSSPCLPAISRGVCTKGCSSKGGGGGKGRRRRSALGRVEVA